MKATFEKMPEMLTDMQADITEIKKVLTELAGKKGIDALPIDRAELCRRLGKTPATIIKWEKQGRIPFKRIGRTIRYDFEEVLKAMNQN